MNDVEKTMRTMFAPGCALTIYKPHLAERLHRILIENLGAVERLDTCCRNHPPLADGDRVINTCPGCDRRYREDYANASTISLWETLAGCDFFPFPDYGGKTMTISDACPTRGQARIHRAVRALLGRMNITLVEPARTGANGACCGDTFWGVLPVEEVKRKMAERAAEMPVDDVVVYCVSCSVSVSIGRKSPRYLVDLLFGEPTEPKTLDPAAWHRLLDEFIAAH